MKDEKMNVTFTCISPSVLLFLLNIKSIWLLFPFNLRISSSNEHLYTYMYIASSSLSKLNENYHRMTNRWERTNELYFCHFLKQSTWQLANMFSSHRWMFLGVSWTNITHHRTTEISSKSWLYNKIYMYRNWITHTLHTIDIRTESGQLIWIVNNLMHVSIDD